MEIIFEGSNKTIYFDFPPCNRPISSKEVVDDAFCDDIDSSQCHLKRINGSHNWFIRSYPVFIVSYASCSELINRGTILPGMQIIEEVMLRMLKVAQIQSLPLNVPSFILVQRIISYVIITRKRTYYES
ncbi:hypothetical protein RCL_jg6636.t1 [Rhizophagus clarus]|uniref:Uncharacterized protein n=1 Tax=Rhizophagus clarus TaxID=94130 RepID=A0A8H3LGN8_9GLOM|nr:hypothetical protein RCL_jg6636.t1 [Rhizophagus clarus]